MPFLVVALAAFLQGTISSTQWTPTPSRVPSLPSPSSLSPNRHVLGAVGVHMAPSYPVASADESPQQVTSRAALTERACIPSRLVSRMIKTRRQAPSIC